MLMLVFIKIAADLALYFTFAGFLAVLYGAEGWFVFAGMLLLAVAFTISYVLRKWNWGRFLPLVLPLALIMLWGRLGDVPVLEMVPLAGYVVMVPAAAYVVYLIASRIYEPDRYSQMSIFSVFWKVFLFFSFLMIVAGKSEEITAVSVPMAVIMLASSVLILRSLRHEPEVYLQRKYQLVNLFSLLGVIGGVLFLSSETMVMLVVTVVKCIYQWLVLPILMLVIYIFAGIVGVLVKLFSFVKLTKPESGEQPQMQIMNVNEIFGEIAPGSSNEEIFMRIFVALGIIAALGITVVVFRALARRDKTDAVYSGVKDERSATVLKRGRKNRAPESTHVEKVRQQYRGFLQAITVHGITAEQSDTSLDIDRQYRMAAADGKLAGELREIYIAARYDGNASDEDVRRAREICAEIKKSVEI